MQAYQQLELEFAEFMNADAGKMVACSSGTAALHLALEVLKVSIPSSPLRIVVPDFTMVACPRAVTLAGLENAFVDVTERGVLEENPTLQMTVMSVHMYGRQSPTNFSGIVIEDLAEAHGMFPNPNSQAACWSFYQNKIIAGEEGGIVAFKEKEQADLARSLRCLGMTEAHNFYHIPRGHNYRMSNCHAELVLASLDNFETNIEKRRVIEYWYDQELPIEMHRPPREVPWVYDIQLPSGITNDQVVPKLNTKGIQARYSFKPMSKQEEYCSPFQEQHPMSERLSRETFYFPIQPGMEKADVVGYVNCLLKILENVPA